MNRPFVTFEESTQGLAVLFEGRLISQTLGELEGVVAKIRTDATNVQLNLTNIEALDTGGAWVLTNLKHQLESGGAEVTFVGGQADHKSVLETVAQRSVDLSEPEAPPRGFTDWVERAGQSTIFAWQGTLNVLEFLGMTLHRLVRSLIFPWRLRRASLFTQMAEAGFNAVPIVALMGFLIGVVLAFQGATQLSQFGAQIFVVDLISISILRELGVLLTAIIIAGRSGSAFTAAIGSMKVQEEIDAMRALGLDPMEVLVVPRTLALLIVLPILTMIANIAGLVGGSLMSWIDLGVSPGMFFNRLQEITSIWHPAVGLIKAPFFALIIGVVSCYQAMQVKGSSQSLGARTTKSVVQAIFGVILADAIFSVFFSAVGV